VSNEDLQKLNIKAQSWQFLSQPERYRTEWHQVHPEAPPLLLEATRRQMLTAAEILSRFRDQFGVLLADDVGLGKTLVAVLVAGLFTSQGQRVRILAPNDTMRRKWETDAIQHFAVLARFGHLNLSPNAVKGGRMKLAKLHASRVQVTTHSKASKQENLSCDLLIVDEAHRARGEQTIFRQELEHQCRRGRVGRLLFLTATPFSIDLQQFVRMLRLIGASQDDRRNVSTFGDLLMAFWNNSRSLSHDKWEEKLKHQREEAVRSLRKWVIRHSVEELSADERAYFGRQDDTWDLNVRDADRKTLEILLRSDRMLRLAKAEGLIAHERTNDPRFHVGWNHLRTELTRVEDGLNTAKVQFTEQSDGRGLISLHTKSVRASLSGFQEHPKIAAVADEVQRVVNQEDEKVLVFCHHHATAAEIAHALRKRLPTPPRRSKAESLLESAWLEVYESNLRDLSVPRAGELRAFIRWLSCPLLYQQVARWMGLTHSDENLRMIPNDIAKLLRQCPGRYDGQPSIAEASKRLFESLEASGSSSTQAILRLAVRKPDTQHFPSERVIAVADPDEMDGSPSEDESRLFYRKQPDIMMAIFNSPFGPEVLVVTDRLSEGVDLHRYCRHIVHYELSPSPIRIVQRNGRVRRLGSWASTTNRSIRVVYPAFGETRDQRLVEIMKARLKRFDLLLGGTGAKIEGSVLDEDERWKYEILARLPRLRAPLAVAGAPPKG
jgi:ERCC4-related helicase